MKKLFPFAILLAFAAGCTHTKKDPPKTLYIPVSAKIKGLDPILADDLYSAYEVYKVYENLLQYSYLKRPYQLEPSLVETMPTLSADKKTYVFHLKKGVLFQDDACFPGGHGREMTSEDVIYSFKRLADPKNSSPGWWTVDGKIAGLNAWHDEATKAPSTDYSKPIAGLKALDRYTVQIELVKPNYQFAFALAMPFTAIVPREAVEKYGKDFVNHPVGTGPFKLVEFNPSSKLVWDRNPTYRNEVYPSEGAPGDREKGLLEDAGKPLPRVDRVVTVILEEDQPRWLNFMAGKLDLLDIPKDNFDTAIGKDKDLLPDLKQKGVRLDKTPALDVTHASFNMLDPLIGKNKLLRQAISMAYDQAKFIELFYNGRAIPAQGPIPPGLSGYDENFKNPYRQYDVAKAKALLAKAGYPGGKGLPVLEITAQSSSTNRQMSEYLQKALSLLGINSTINSGSWPEFMAAVKNHKGQLWEFAWQGDYPDAEDFLQLFYSKNVSPGPNDANYSNPEFDRLYEKSLTLPESRERTAIYKQMVQLLVEDAPWIFGSHRVIYTLQNPWMRNFKYHAVAADMWKYYGIDPALRK